jgi:hypothetical protein
MFNPNDSNLPQMPRHTRITEIKNRLRYANTEAERQLLRTELDFWQRHR